jgi:hypothetical protein
MQRVVQIEELWIARSDASPYLYCAWFDAQARQTRYASLHTTDLVRAIEKVRSIIDRRLAHDPRLGLKDSLLSSVVPLLDWHWETHASHLSSADSEEYGIDLIKRLLGDPRLAALDSIAFDSFRDRCLQQGLAISSISKVLSTLRSAANRAFEGNRIARPLKIPEYRTKTDIETAPLRGPVGTPEQFGKLFDATEELHLLMTLIASLNTLTRPGAIFEATGAQIDLGLNRFDLNPAGRRQTKKFRPIVPITATFRPWLEDLPPGHLITYNGLPVSSVKTALNHACKLAQVDLNLYSPRHSVARHMRELRVDSDEISIFLGHKVPKKSETTLRYAPWSPQYLTDAAAAVEDFIHRIQKHTRRNLLLPPWKWKP